MFKLSLVMSHEEGYGIIGAIPTTHNNPLDLRHSPHSMHLANYPNGIGLIASATAGWEDADRQLIIYSKLYCPIEWPYFQKRLAPFDPHRLMNLQEMLYEFAPPSENLTDVYLDYVCREMPCSPIDLIKDLIKIEVSTFLSDS
jgi:hypothetical protein